MPTNLKDPFRNVPGPHPEGWQDRRQFLQTLALGGSAASLTLLLSTLDSRAAGQTEAVLLSCMDFRLVAATARYMASRGLTDKYDHIVLAGAALGALTDKFPAWNQTFWDHVGMAIDLHKIHQVIVLDHRDCGAYKAILGEDFAQDAAQETAIHTTQLQRLSKRITEKYPALEVELLLMALDGKVETIS
jgi:carbonic anhydrase